MYVESKLLMKTVMGGAPEAVVPAARLRGWSAEHWKRAGARMRRVVSMALANSSRGRVSSSSSPVLLLKKMITSGPCCSCAAKLSSRTGGAVELRLLSNSVRTPSTSTQKLAVRLLLVRLLLLVPEATAATVTWMVRSSSVRSGNGRAKVTCTGERVVNFSEHGTGEYVHGHGRCMGTEGPVWVYGHRRSSVGA